jgi:lipopolysaccharide heptosyltransferase I
MRNGLPRILIIRLSAIGDVVRVLPALHCVRDAYPNAQIDWIVERKAADLLIDHPDIDDVLIFERPETGAAREFLALCRRIRARRYDIVIDFHGILKSGLLVAASGARERYGFARPRAQEGSFLFTNRKVKLGPEIANRIHENLALVEPLAPGRKKLDVTISVPDNVQETVEEYFHDTFDGAKWVVAMHVPVDRKEKQWPLEHFAALADMLLADGRFEVMLTYGPGQEAMARRVELLSTRHPIVAPELGSLKEYAWVARCADLYFGGDTGPMHIASAMETPVVAVFGGTDPEKHAPLRRPYLVLTAEGSGSSDADGTAAERLRRVTPEAAYDACVAMASGRIA